MLRTGFRFVSEVRFFWRKQQGRSRAKTYSLVSVMFTDFKDFTAVSERVSGELLVAEIDHCFSAFDDIIGRYNIEKIKTIGDAYLCAGGIPVAETHNPAKVAAAFARPGSSPSLVLCPSPSGDQSGPFFA